MFLQEISPSDRYHSHKKQEKISIELSLSKNLFAMMLPSKVTTIKFALVREFIRIHKITFEGGNEGLNARY